MEKWPYSISLGRFVMSGKGLVYEKGEITSADGQIDVLLLDAV